MPIGDTLATRAFVVELVQLVLEAKQRDRDAEARWIADIAARVAVQVARQMLPEDKLRAGASEPALVAVTESLPALVKAARASTLSTVSRETYVGDDVDARDIGRGGPAPVLGAPSSVPSPAAQTTRAKQLGPQRSQRRTTYLADR